MRFRCIEDHRDTWPVRVLCAALEVSASGYYGKPGPVVMLQGLVQFHAIKHGWTLRNV